MINLLQDDKLRYSLTGDETCLRYFWVNPENGNIALSKLFEDTEIDKFEVGSVYM